MKNQLKNSTEVSKTEEIQNLKKTWQEPELKNLSVEGGLSAGPESDASSPS